MNKQVTFEVAKLLKEKGFDMPCNSCYEHALNTQINPESNEPSGTFGWKEGETNLQSGFFINDYDGIDFSNDSWYMCAAPIIADVVMWLYEKHKIWISVDWLLETEDRWHFLLTRKLKDSVWVSDGNPLFNSPTEAYLSAIEYTLKKLL